MSMEVPIWQDRVWLSLVLGPFAWMAIFLPFLDWSGVDLRSLWAVSFCLNLGVVSIFLPTIRGRVTDQK